MNLADELLKSMQIMINRKLKNYKADHTFKSVIKSVTPKGYVILDETGSERTVPCCIPGLELKVGQYVWVKIPMNRLNDIHICGVAVNRSNSSRRR